MCPPARNAGKTNGMTNDKTKSERGNEDDEGYKTDEEWGGNWGPIYQDSGTNNLLPRCGPLAIHKGSSSSLKVRTDYYPLTNRLVYRAKASQ